MPGRRRQGCRSREGWLLAANVPDLPLQFGIVVCPYVGVSVGGGGVFRLHTNVLALLCAPLLLL
jgi:hypothetical protein